MIDLLSVEQIEKNILDITIAIEREKALGESDYSMEGESYAKK